MSENRDENSVPAAGDKELDDLLNSALADMKLGDPSDTSAEGGMKRSPVNNMLNTTPVRGPIEGYPEAAVKTKELASAMDIGYKDEMRLESKKARARAFKKGNMAMHPTLQNRTAMNRNTEYNYKDMYSGMNTPGQNNSSSNIFVPFMKEMMQSLLSKDVLYPSLKDTVDKYPTWLEKNKRTLKPEDLEKYTKQFDLMKKVCKELEGEAEKESPQMKRERFDRVLILMQQMQESGPPPKELSGESSGDIPGFQSQMDPSRCKTM